MPAISRALRGRCWREPAKRPRRVHRHPRCHRYSKSLNASLSPYMSRLSLHVGDDAGLFSAVLRPTQTATDHLLIEVRAECWPSHVDCTDGRSVEPFGKHGVVGQDAQSTFAELLDVVATHPASVLPETAAAGISSYCSIAARTGHARPIRQRRARLCRAPERGSSRPACDCAAGSGRVARRPKTAAGRTLDLLAFVIVESDLSALEKFLLDVRDDAHVLELAIGILAEDVQVEAAIVERRTKRCVSSSLTPRKGVAVRPISTASSRRCTCRVRTSRGTWCSSKRWPRALRRRRSLPPDGAIRIAAFRCR